MVHFTTLVGVLASAAMVVAVPVQGRTSHEAEKAQEYQPSYEPQAAQAEYKPDEYKQDWQQSTEAAMAVETSSSMSHETTTTMATYESPKETAKAVETSPAYGSGWVDKSGYNDCVSQCMAKFGGGSAPVYQPASTGEAVGSVGDGATHTVIVAPAQGVLRYVPPFIDANVGDTVLFKWGANNHTVTKSSQLLPCNKTSDALFASGTQNKDFTFTQKINDTNPTFFYCATPGHCPKGMFGIINFGKADNASNSSAAAWMQSANASMSSESKSYASYTQQMTANSSVAANWGSNFDMATLPDWAKEPMAQNIMYMRNVIAMNPDIVDQSGSVNMASDAPMMLPNDVALAATSSEGSNTASGSGAAPAAASSTVAAEAAGAVAQPNGAGAVTSSKFVMGAAVVFATYLLL